MELKNIYLASNICCMQNTLNIVIMITIKYLNISEDIKIYIKKYISQSNSTKISNNNPKTLKF